MVMFWEQNAGRSHSINTDGTSFETGGDIKFLGKKTITNQNSIQDEIKSRLKSGNACYLSIQNILSYSLLSKNLKIKVYKTNILPVSLYGWENWLFTLREGGRLRVFENCVLRRKCGSKRDKMTLEWRKLPPPKVIRVMKSRTLKRPGYVARMGRQFSRIFVKIICILSDEFNWLMQRSVLLF